MWCYPIKCARISLGLHLLLVTAAATNCGISWDQHRQKSCPIFAPASGAMSRAARAIVNKFLSVEQAEGVGARVRRSVGRPEVSPSPLLALRDMTPAPHLLLCS